MRTLPCITLLLTALLLGGAPAALATTPGPACRAACAPRIAQDCGAPGVRGFRKCKRRLVRACKQTTPEIACAASDVPAPTGGATAPVGPGGGADGRDPGTGGGRAARITAALANRLVRTGSDRFFSGGTITESDEMTLCGSGQMRLVVTTITSTSSADFSNTFDSTETFDGTWTVRLASGAAVLELATGEPQPRRFAVALDAAGAVVIDGRVASIDDAAGSCGGNGAATPDDGQPPGATTPGTDDLVAQVTRALADQVLSIEETNPGFGRRVTTMVLCASGRYALEINASVIPGIEVSTRGDWTVRLDGSTVTLELEGDQPTRAFTIGSDARGDLLLNDLPVRSGDPALVTQVCPGL